MALRLLAGSLTALVIVSLAAGVASPAQAVSTGALHRERALDAGLTSAINRVRLHARLRPLRLSSGLVVAAAEHSVEMAARGYFSHVLPGGVSIADRIGSTYSHDGFRTWRVGENLLWSTQRVSGSSVVKLWLASSGHRANLLDGRWTEVGCSAVTVGRDGHRVTLVTCDFGERR